MSTTIPRVAKTVQAVANRRNPLVRRLLDRTQALTPAFVARVIKQTQFGFAGRKPRVSLDDTGAPRPTDMDLFSFLVGALARNAIIEIPYYVNRTPKQLTEHTRHIGMGRFGKLIDLVAHREHLSLSVTIIDQTMVTSDPVSFTEASGQPRTYLVVDYTGNWYRGCYGVGFKPTPAEAAFQKRYLLNTEGQNRFKRPLHPNRRESIFGAPYLCAKLLLTRIEDELAHTRRELTRQETEQAITPFDAYAPTIIVGEKASIMVPTFTVSLMGDHLALEGDYAACADYVEARSLYVTLEQFRTRVQFIVRAAEIAFYHHGLKTNAVAPWIKGISWQTSASADPHVTMACIRLTNSLTLRYKADMVSKAVAAA